MKILQSQINIQLNELVEFFTTLYQGLLRANPPFLWKLRSTLTYKDGFGEEKGVQSNNLGYKLYEKDDFGHLDIQET